jgi:hypothetical protein
MTKNSLGILWAVLLLLFLSLSLIVVNLMVHEEIIKNKEEIKFETPSEPIETILDFTTPKNKEEPYYFSFNSKYCFKTECDNGTDICVVCYQEEKK